jgi:predicted nucleic acid-binding protein
VILVDSNIPMYLVGAPHPHKADAQRLLERLITDRQRLVTDAEVLQEVLRRYFAIGRRDAIQPTFDALLGVVDQVLAVDVAVVPRAKQIVLRLRASWRSSKKRPTTQSESWGKTMNSSSPRSAVRAQRTTVPPR